MIRFTGDKYMYSGHEMPNLWSWIRDKVNLTDDHPKPAQTDMEIDPP